jgi:hypothetical protein
LVEFEIFFESFYYTLKYINIFADALSTAGAEERWEKIRALQPTDAEVKRAIAYEFGIYGGSTSPQMHAHAGGINPKFWMNDVNLCNPPTLTGQALIDLVREILDL